MEYTADILSLDYEGRGVAKTGGRTVFIANALPQETVRFRIVREKNGFAEAEAEEILVPSPQRSTPPCPHYGECGGCAMQHIGFEPRRAAKSCWATTPAAAAALSALIPACWCPNTFQAA